MGTDPQAEVLSRIARYKQLIERSRKLREKSNVLIERSHQLFRIAMGQEVDEVRQQPEDKSTDSFNYSSTSQDSRLNR
jgi:hypothetical protein